MNIRELEMLAAQIKEPLETLLQELTHEVRITDPVTGAVREIIRDERDIAIIRVGVALGVLPVGALGIRYHTEQIGPVPEDHAALRVRQMLTGESADEYLQRLTEPDEPVAPDDAPPDGQTGEGESATVADGEPIVVDLSSVNPDDLTQTPSDLVAVDDQSAGEAEAESVTVEANKEGEPSKPKKGGKRG